MNDESLPNDLAELGIEPGDYFVVRSRTSAGDDGFSYVPAGPPEERLPRLLQFAEEHELVVLRWTPGWAGGSSWEELNSTDHTVDDVVGELYGISLGTTSTRLGGSGGSRFGMCDSCDLSLEQSTVDALDLAYAAMSAATELWDMFGHAATAAVGGLFATFGGGVDSRRTLRAFHGAPAANALSIVDSGTLVPSGGEIWMSSDIAETWVHGADRSRRAAYSLDLTVDLGDVVPRRDPTRVVAPNAIVLETSAPLQVEVNGLHVRRPNPEGLGFDFEHITDGAEIRRALGGE